MVKCRTYEAKEVGNKNVEVVASKAVGHKYTAGVITKNNANDLTSGSTISYTVAWEGSDGKQYSNTLSFDVEVVKDAAGTAVTDVILTSGDGTEYSIGTQQKPSGAQLSNIFAEEFKKDERLTGDFNISVANNQVVFEAKEVGTSAGKINSVNIGGTGQGTPTAVAGVETHAIDSFKKIDATALKVVTAKSTTEDLKAAIFEINGKQFIVQKSGTDALTSAQLDELGPDIHVLNAQNTTVAQADMEGIRDEINRRTGLDFETIDNATAQGANVKDAGLTDTDLILVTEDFDLAINADNSLSLQVGDTSTQTIRVSVDM